MSSGRKRWLALVVLVAVGSQIALVLSATVLGVFNNPAPATRHMPLRRKQAEAL